MLTEKRARAWSGWLMVFFLLALLIGSGYLVVESAKTGDGWMVAAWSLLFAAAAVCLFGFIVVAPNQAQVVLLFGHYLGTVRDSGFWWMNPLCTKRRISLRIRNFETMKSKVNDHLGNPIEIAAIVVWKVVETAEAVFHVDDYENFVKVQSEAAVRNMATSYPYDTHDDDKQMSLRGNTAEIAKELQRETRERLEKAGIEVLEARISYLAYAPEIAGAMLRRQQATAIVAARHKFVQGAVSMVEMALDMLSRKGVVQLDEERKAAMVSNMLVVLCSDQHTQPVVNTGTLHQ